jgi:membrane protein
VTATILSLLTETFRRWNSDRVPRMGAALSFYTVFSMAPLSILLLTLVGLVVERSAAREEMVAQARGFVGVDGAKMVEMILTSTSMESESSLWLTLLGFAVLLVGASGMFVEIQDSLNQIWEVSSKRHPVFVLLRERALSIVMILVLGVVMVLSFLFSAVTGAAVSYLGGKYPILGGSWDWGVSILSLVAIAMLFALIFRFVPDARIAWKDVWLGAGLTALLFAAGKGLLGFYFGRSAIASSYGAAGSLIIILVWVFYSAQIMLFGAEFTHVYAMRHGSHREESQAVV